MGPGGHGLLEAQLLRRHSTGGQRFVPWGRDGHGSCLLKREEQQLCDNDGKPACLTSARRGQCGARNPPVASNKAAQE